VTLRTKNIKYLEENFDLLKVTLTLEDVVEIRKAVYSAVVSGEGIRTSEQGRTKVLTKSIVLR